MFEGTDLLAIEEMSYSTVLALMSEVGIKSIRKFPTAKHFASWLRLAPNNKISGGKVLSSRVPKGSNRLKIALRNATNAIGNLKEPTPFKGFFPQDKFPQGKGLGHQCHGTQTRGDHLEHGGKRNPVHKSRRRPVLGSEKKTRIGQKN